MFCFSINVFLELLKRMLKPYLHINIANCDLDQEVLVKYDKYF